MTGEPSSMLPRRFADVVWVTVDGEIVALDRHGRSHVIASTGALLWELLDGSSTAAELADDVADVFGIDVDQARRDVDRFVEEMVALGLIDGSRRAEVPPG